MTWPRWSEAIVAAMALVVALGIGFAAGGGARGAAPNGSLTVTANGSAWVAPDEAQINLGAQETAPTAPEALKKLADAAAALLKAVGKYGIKPAQVQTSNLNLSQNYGPSGVPQGYQAQEQFTVTTRDLRHLGTVVSAATAAGANQLNGLQLLTADPNAGRQQAVQFALKSARAQAGREAAELGVTLGGVRSVSVSASQPFVPYMMFGAHAAVAQASSAPIATGNQQVQVSVRVTYSFR